MKKWIHRSLKETRRSVEVENAYTGKYKKHHVIQNCFYSILNK